MSNAHVIRLGHPLDAVPPLAWLGALAVALWPHWRWAAARLADGSDDPLGLAALAALAWALARLAPQLHRRAEPGWLAATIALTAAATAAHLAGPPLAGALLAALALAALVAAYAPRGSALAPLAGLAVLALPVISSLQFYGGYPLRVIAAELSRPLLRAAGHEVARAGTTLVVDGRTMIVDAPCSGVQMVWVGYFVACALAVTSTRLSDAAFLRRLPVVGLLVLLGNVLRNTVLVALQARSAQALPEAWHEGIGLAVLALVCAAVAAWMHQGAARVAR